MCTLTENITLNQDQINKILRKKPNVSVKIMHAEKVN